MTSPRQKPPKLRGHVLVSAAALLLVAGIVLAKTQGVLARPDGNQSAAMTAASVDAVNSIVSQSTPVSPVTNDWYSAQLHLHGWSNHNGATQPGALQYHSLWADNAGLDVIWWSEHNPTFYQVSDTTVDLSQATLPTGSLNVQIPLPPGTPSLGHLQLRHRAALQPQRQRTGHGLTCQCTGAHADGQRQRLWL